MTECAKQEVQGNEGTKNARAKPEEMKGPSSPAGLAGRFT